MNIKLRNIILLSCLAAVGNLLLLSPAHAVWTEARGGLDRSNVFAGVPVYASTEIYVANVSNIPTISNNNNSFVVNMPLINKDNRLLTIFTVPWQKKDAKGRVKTYEVLSVKLSNLNEDPLTNKLSLDYDYCPKYDYVDDGDDTNNLSFNKQRAYPGVAMTDMSTRYIGIFDDQNHMEAQPNQFGVSVYLLPDSGSPVEMFYAQDYAPQTSGLAFAPGACYASGENNRPSSVFKFGDQLVLNQHRGGLGETMIRFSHLDSLIVNGVNGQMLDFEKWNSNAEGAPCRFVESVDSASSGLGTYLLPAASHTDYDNAYFCTSKGIQSVSMPDSIGSPWTQYSTVGQTITGTEKNVLFKQPMFIKNTVMAFDSNSVIVSNGSTYYTLALGLPTGASNTICDLCAFPNTNTDNNIFLYIATPTGLYKQEFDPSTAGNSFTMHAKQLADGAFYSVYRDYESGSIFGVCEVWEGNVQKYYLKIFDRNDVLIKAVPLPVAPMTNSANLFFDSDVPYQTTTNFMGQTGKLAFGTNTIAYFGDDGTFNGKKSAVVLRTWQTPVAAVGINSGNLNSVNNLLATPFDALPSVETVASGDSFYVDVDFNNGNDMTRVSNIIVKFTWGTDSSSFAEIPVYFNDLEYQTDNTKPFKRKFKINVDKVNNRYVITNHNEVVIPLHPVNSLQVKTVNLDGHVSAYSSPSYFYYDYLPPYPPAEPSIEVQSQYTFIPVGTGSFVLNTSNFNITFKGSYDPDGILTDTGMIVPKYTVTQKGSSLVTNITGQAHGTLDKYTAKAWRPPGWPNSTITWEVRAIDRFGHTSDPTPVSLSFDFDTPAKPGIPRSPVTISSESLYISWEPSSDTAYNLYPSAKTKIVYWIYPYWRQSTTGAFTPLSPLSTMDPPYLFDDFSRNDYLIEKMTAGQYFFKVRAQNCFGTFSATSDASAIYSITGRVAFQPSAVYVSTESTSNIITKDQLHAKYPNMPYTTDEPLYYLTTSTPKVGWRNPSVPIVGGVKEASYYYLANTVYDQASSGKLNFSKYGGNVVPGNINPVTLDAVSDGRYAYGVSLTNQAGLISPITLFQGVVAIDLNEIPTIVPLIIPGNANAISATSSNSFRFSAFDKGAGIRNTTLTLYSDASPNALTTIDATPAYVESSSQVATREAAFLPFSASLLSKDPHAFDGAYHWQLQAYDRTGHLATYPSYGYTSFTIDTSAPIITVETTAVSNPQFSYQVFDKTSGITLETIAVSHSNGTTTTIDTTETINYFSGYAPTYQENSYTLHKELSPGQYAYAFIATDAAGNVTTKSDGFNITNSLTLNPQTDSYLSYSDATGKTYTLLIPTTKMTWSFQKNGQYISDLTQIKTLRLKVDSLAWKNLSVNSSTSPLIVKDISGLDSGVHKFLFEITDNFTTAYVTYEYATDLNPPLLNNNPNAQLVLTTSSATANDQTPVTVETCALSDDLSGLTSMNLIATADAQPGSTYVQQESDSRSYSNQINRNQLNYKGVTFNLAVGYTWHFEMDLTDSAGNVRVIQQDLYVQNPSSNRLSKITVMPTNIPVEVGQYLSLVATPFAVAKNELVDMSNFTWSATGDGTGQLWGYGRTGTFSPTTPGIITIEVVNPDFPTIKGTSTLLIIPAHSDVIKSITLSGPTSVLLNSNSVYTAQAWSDPDSNGNSSQLPATFAWSTSPSQPTWINADASQAYNATFIPTAAGTYRILAKAGDATGIITVEVKDKSPFTIRFEDTCPASLVVESSFDLSPYLLVYDATGRISTLPTGTSVSWALAPAGKGTISSAGVITAPKIVSKQLTATVQAGTETAVRTFEAIAGKPTQYIIAPQTGPFVLLPDDELTFKVVYMDKNNNVAGSSQSTYVAPTVTAVKSASYTPLGLTGFTLPTYQIYTLPADAAPTITGTPAKIKPKDIFKLTLSAYGVPDAFITSLPTGMKNGDNSITGTDQEGNFQVSAQINTSPCSNYPQGHQLSSATAFYAVSLPPRIVLEQEVNGVYTAVPKEQEYFSKSAKLRFHLNDSNYISLFNYTVAVDAVQTYDSKKLGAQGIESQGIEAYSVLDLSSSDLSIGTGDHQVDIRANATDGVGDNTVQTFSFKVSDSAKIIGTALAAPNPSAGRPDIFFTLSADSPLQLFLYDLGGRLIWQKSVNGTAGLNKIKWDADASNGTYLGLIKIGSNTYKFEVAIVK